MSISDIPIATAYYQESNLLLGAATALIFEIANEREAAERSGFGIEDNYQQRQYEHACQHVLRNALVFTQQAYEMFLRGQVCDVSPFLLIPDQNSWINKASSKKYSFSEIKSVSAVDLPNLIDAVAIDLLPIESASLG